MGVMCSEKDGGAHRGLFSFRATSCSTVGIPRGSVVGIDLSLHDRIMTHEESLKNCPLESKGSADPVMMGQ